MSKTKHKDVYELEDYENHCHLWNIFAGGNSLVLLRKIVDSIHYNNYARPGKRLPSLIVTGDQRRLVAKAFINSLKIEDIRECPGLYLDNGISSSHFFEDSLINTAHLITDTEHMTKTGESVVWRYLKEGKCGYYNFNSKNYDKIVHCNGLIILTSKNPGVVPQSIIKEVDHCVAMEPCSAEQIKMIICQQLKFCDIPYKGEAVLEEIVKTYPMEIGVIMRLLKTCIVLLRADLSNYLTVKIVRTAKRLCSLPVPPPPVDDIPF